MNLCPMIAVLAAAGMGVALAAASHAQTAPNVSAAASPKATSDTAPPASAAERKPASAAAPSTHTINEANKGEAVNAAKVQPGKGPEKAR